MLPDTIRAAVTLLMCSFLLVNGVFAIAKGCQSLAGKPRSALLSWGTAVALCGVALSIIFDPLLLTLAYIFVFATIFTRASELLTNQKMMGHRWLYLLLGARTYSDGRSLYIIFIAILSTTTVLPHSRAPAHRSSGQLISSHGSMATKRRFES